MPDRRKHRGPGPGDLKWFSGAVRPALGSAASDLAWLLSRGYAEASSVKLVGDRHRLVERQRVAVLRSSCSDQDLASRRARHLDVGQLRGRPIRIDGFNLILTLESALGGGVVLGGRDGCYRDLASVHGTYRRVDPAGPGEPVIRSQVEFQNMARELAVDDPIRPNRVADPHQLFRAGDSSMF